MKRVSFVALAALVSASGCGRPPQTTDNASFKPEAKGNAAAAEDALTVTKEFLVGTWTPDGDCSATITFAADGTTTVEGGKTARWELEAPFITVTVPGEPDQKSPIARTGEKVVFQGKGGRVMTLTRCPTSEPPGPQGNVAGKAGSMK